MRPALLLTLALMFTPAAHAAPAQPKTQQLAVFKVAALASAAVTPATLRASGVTAETVTIPADYLYRRDLRVRAYDLDAFLKSRIPDVEALAAQGAQVMFWCRDGYAPMAKLSDLLGRGGLIAVADADVPADMQWPNAPYKTSILTAPEIGNYVVWRAAQFPATPQPWGLETIYVLPAGTALKK